MRVILSCSNKGELVLDPHIQMEDASKATSHCPVGQCASSYLTGVHAAGLREPMWINDNTSLPAHDMPLQQVLLAVQERLSSYP